MQQSWKQALAPRWLLPPLEAEEETGEQTSVEQEQLPSLVSPLEVVEEEEEAEEPTSAEQEELQLSVLQESTVEQEVLAQQASRFYQSVWFPK